MKNKKGSLYLIPTKLGDSPYENIFPNLNREIILSLKTFIIEDLRSSRRFLKSLKYPGNFDDVQFYLLNEHTQEEETQEYLDRIYQGEDIGLLSDAGMPCIADPGNIIVQKAHEEDVDIKVLIGPSSIFLALAASGFNGQNFTFHGYLPVKDQERNRTIKEIEKRVWQNNQTQIFIETPYRNQKIFEALLKNCSEALKLCIACDVTLESEFIKTKYIIDWKQKTPPIHKRPAVFLLGQ